VDAGFDALKNKVSEQMLGKKSGGSSSDGKKVSCWVVVHIIKKKLSL
jgi:hypothetical protein